MQEELTLNGIEGRLYKNGKALSPLPLDILSHPSFKRLGLSQQCEVSVSIEGQQTVLNDKGNCVIFIKNGDNTHNYCVQKQLINAKGEKEWYQLQALSKEQLSSLHLSYVFDSQTISVSALLSEANNLFWRGVSNPEVCLITTDNMTLLYEFESIETYFSYQTPWKISTPDGKQLCAPDSSFHKIVESIEDPRFIHIHKYPESDKHEIYLPRYTQSFYKDNLETPLYFIREEEKYTLLESAASISSSIQGLTFINEKEEQIIIYPLQRLIKAKKAAPNSEYHTLTLDISHQVATIEIGRKNIAAPLWQYSNTERLLTYEIDNETKSPIAQSLKEALYLIYLYLGSNQEKKALDILTECTIKFSGLSGAIEELELISWIINAQPYLMAKEDSDATVITPQLIACQLKTLTLISKFFQKENHFNYPKAVNLSECDNGLYQTQRMETLQAFEKNTPQIIAKLYTRYLTLLRDNEVNFLLTQSEKQSLLTFLYHAPERPQNNEGMLIGPLGYEWSHLQLAVLEKEKQTLLITNDTTPFGQRRQKAIEQIISNHEGVFNHVTNIEEKKEPLRLPNTLGFKQNQLNYELYAQIKWTTNYLELFAQVQTLPENFEIPSFQLNDKEEGFIKQFLTYLQIATQKETSKVQENLKLACLHFIDAYPYLELNDQIKNSNIFLLSNLLLILMAQEKLTFPRYCSGIDSLVEHVKTLTGPLRIKRALTQGQKTRLISAMNIIKTLPPMKKREPIYIENDKRNTKKALYSDDTFPFSTEESANWQALEAGNVSKTVEENHRAESSLSAFEKTDEFTSGKNKFKQKNDLKALATALLTADKITMLSEHITDKRNSLQKDLKKLEKESMVFLLSNYSAQEALLSKIQVAALVRQEVKMNDLIKLYYKNDYSQYQETLNLTETKNIDTLHALIARYIALALKEQQCHRIEKQITLILDQNSEEDLSQMRVKLGQLCFAENHVCSHASPDLSAFQYFQNILIRQDQLDAISRLTMPSTDQEFSNQVEKIIMGGGKSKVILPAIAYKKANGTNLIIIEVPKALLETNYTDLKRTSLELFGQSAETFHFDRNKKCSVAYLEQRYHFLLDVMRNKKYIVTTGDSIQSIELTYIELLYLKPSQAEGENTTHYDQRLKKWAKEVSLSKEILTLFRERGELIIDEIHQGLRIKSKLNYSLGNTKKIKKSTLDNTLSLYEFLHWVTFDDKEGHTKNLLDIIKDNRLLSTTIPLKTCMDLLIEQLITHSKSPLLTFCRSLSQNEKRALKDYLHNCSSEIPPFILEASMQNKDQLALYKQQVNQLLPYTMTQKLGVHYGPSKNPHLAALTKAIAIPYVANNTPNEGCRFGNELETLNFSIQSQLISGVPKILIHAYIKRWKTKLQEEMSHNLSCDVDNNPVSNAFKKAVNDQHMSLYAIDLTKEDVLSALHEKLGKNPLLIIKVLSELITPGIESNPKVLSSDAFNHVNTVRTCTGLTGTPYNISTFHQKLNFDPNASKGSDGLIYQTLLHKKSAVIAHDYRDTKTSIHDLLSHYDDTAPLRALIDVNALFKGVSNSEIANQIALFFKNNPQKFIRPKKIKHILYFNQANQLCALPLMKEPPTPIEIGDTALELINKKLKSTPEERFTLYDQSHSVGVDITQMNNAKALVMIDEKTMISSAFQGVMRLRGFIDGDQTLDFIVPTSMKDQTVKEILIRLDDNQTTELKEENYQATKMKLNNIIRTKVLTLLLSITDAHEQEQVNKQHEFLDEFDALFIDNQKDDLFALYGQLSRKIKTEILLNNLKEKMIVNFEEKFKRTSLYEANFLEDIKKELTIDMNKVITMTCKHGLCEQEQHSPAPCELSQSIETQTEIEVEVDIEIECKVSNERFKTQLTRHNYAKWPELETLTSSLSTLKALHEQKNERSWSPTLSPLNLTEIGQTSAGDKTPHFSPKLFATSNFYINYVGERDYLNDYLKNAYTLLFIQIPTTTFDFECYMLSQEEANQLSTQLIEKPNNKVCMSTFQQTLLFGDSDFYNRVKTTPFYGELIEQVRYFNGDWSALLPPKESLSWLSVNTHEKLAFFKQYLSPTRVLPSNDIKALETKLLCNQKAYEFIICHPENLPEAHNWSQDYPQISKIQVDELTAMVKITHALYTHYEEGDTTDFSIETGDISETGNIALEKYFLTLCEKARNNEKIRLNFLSIKSPFVTQHVLNKLNTTSFPLTHTLLMEKTASHQLNLLSESTPSKFMTEYLWLVYALFSQPNLLEDYNQYDKSGSVLFITPLFNFFPPTEKEYYIKNIKACMTFSQSLADNVEKLKALLSKIEEPTHKKALLFQVVMLAKKNIETLHLTVLDQPDIDDNILIEIIKQTHATKILNKIMASSPSPLVRKAFLKNEALTNKILVTLSETTEPLDPNLIIKHPHCSPELQLSLITRFEIADALLIALISDSKNSFFIRDLFRLEKIQSNQSIMSALITHPMTLECCRSWADYLYLSERLSCDNRKKLDKRILKELESIDPNFLFIILEDKSFDELYEILTKKYSDNVKEKAYLVLCCIKYLTLQNLEKMLNYKDISDREANKLILYQNIRLDSSQGLENPALLLLAKKIESSPCSTDTKNQIKLVLCSRKTLSAEELHFIVNNLVLNQQQITQLLTSTLDTPTLMLLFKKTMDSTISLHLKCRIKEALCSKSDLKSDELDILINSHEIKNESITLHLSEKTVLTPSQITTLLKHYDISIRSFDTLLPRVKEDPSLLEQLYDSALKSNVPMNQQQTIKLLFCKLDSLSLNQLDKIIASHSINTNEITLALCRRALLNAEQLNKIITHYALTEKSIENLLKHPNMSTLLLEQLFHKAVLQKSSASTQAAIKLKLCQKNDLSSEQLNTIIMHEPITETQIDNLLKHPNMSILLLEQLFDKAVIQESSASTQAAIKLKLCQKNDLSSEQITTLIKSHGIATKEIISTLFRRKDLSAEHLKDFFTHYELEDQQMNTFLISHKDKHCLALFEQLAIKAKKVDTLNSIYRFERLKPTEKTALYITLLANPLITSELAVSMMNKSKTDREFISHIINNQGGENALPILKDKGIQKALSQHPLIIETCVSLSLKQETASAFNWAMRNLTPEKKITLCRELLDQDAPFESNLLPVIYQELKTNPSNNYQQPYDIEFNVSYQLNMKNRKTLTKEEKTLLETLSMPELYQKTKKEIDKLINQVKALSCIDNKADPQFEQYQKETDSALKECRNQKAVDNLKQTINEVILTLKEHEPLVTLDNEIKKREPSYLNKKVLSVFGEPRKEKINALKKQFQTLPIKQRHQFDVRPSPLIRQGLFSNQNQSKGKGAEESKNKNGLTKNEASSYVTKTNDR